MVRYDELVEGTISDVKAFINDNDVDFAKVLAAEKEGKDRKTLKKWLREQQEQRPVKEEPSPRKPREESDSGSLTFSVSPMQAVIASFLVGIFVGGFFMSAIGGGVASPTGAITDTNSNGQEAQGDTQSELQVSKIAMEGEPVLGSEDAPVTLVMYEDYQCPFCEQFESRTMPQLVSNYVDSGDLKVVWKDFPAPSLGHFWAEPSAAAMECVYREAGNDVFWTVKDRLFANSDALPGRSEAQQMSQQEMTQQVYQQIVDWASAEDASGQAIQSCINNDSPMQEVNGDKQEAQSFDVTVGGRPFVGGTPSFVIFSEGDETGEPLVGAQPYSRFSSVIDQKLG